MVIQVKCRCGQRTMSFVRSPGQFYIDDCCKLAGFDHLGNYHDPRKPKKPEEPPRREYRKTGKYTKEGQEKRAAQIAKEAEMRAAKKQLKSGGSNDKPDSDI